MPFIHIQNINDSGEVKIERLQKENTKLREMLWVNHGCEIARLYGDDGEMQCGSCCIDFKRNTLEHIIKLMKERRLK